MKTKFFTVATAIGERSEIAPCLCGHDRASEETSNRRFAGLIPFIAVLAFGFALSDCSGNTSPPDRPDPAKEYVRIIFNIGYTGGTNPGSIRIEKGYSLNTTPSTLPASAGWPADPTRTLYTFQGWFRGAEQYTAQTIINADVTVTARWEIEPSKLEPQPPAEELETLFANGLPANLSNSLKIWGHHNPLLTQAQGADPYAMVYNDRVWIYASNDTFLYDNSGAIVEAAYGNSIQGIRVISSKDLVNWTDHGPMNFVQVTSTNPLVQTPAAKLVTYANATWAPSCVWRTENGVDKFYLYWCDSGNATSVITADSPLGPWSTAGLTQNMINKQMPNCGGVEWLFDPSVLIDYDGDEYDGIGNDNVYMVLGGGGSGANPGNARRVKLDPDTMTRIIGTVETVNVPYLFEAQDLWKWNGLYYLSYCTNWGTSNNPYGFANCEIVYVTSDDPMGTWSDPKRLMIHALNSGDSNNHQRVFDFKGKVYITYHSQRHTRSMGLASGNNYRTAHMDNVTVNNDGSLQRVTQTRTGVEQVETFNPYLVNEAETIGIQGGIYTRPLSDVGSGTSDRMVVTSIDSGDWIGLYGVDFGSRGATKFTAVVKMPSTADYTGGIEIRLDPQGAGSPSTPTATTDLSPTVTARIIGGTVVGRVQLKAQSGEEGKWTVVSADMDQPVTGNHNLVFVFYSSLGAAPETFPPTQANDGRHTNGFEFDQWWFE